MSLPTLNQLYTQFLVTTIGANKTFVALLSAFVVASFTTFYQADDLADTTQSALDDLLQPTTFDFIIIGAGAAGSIVAARLSANYKVLLLEAGGEINPFQLIPALGLGGLNQPNVDWQYKTVPQQNSCWGMKNNQSLWSRGKGLGGSSNLNFMIYSRGNPLDYDNWANYVGDSNWSFSNVTKRFKTVETWDDPNTNYSDPNVSTYHGVNGSLRIAYPTFMGMADRFVAGGQELGYNILTDINLPYTTGFGKVPMNEATNGQRLTPFGAYIQPTRQLNTNLFINKFSQVQKILIDGQKKAYGVRYIRHGKTKEAYATKEVILSAGAIGSPQVLMLSGVGPRAHLESLNIPVLLDQPAIGQNLQDHLSVFLGPFVIDQPLSFLSDRDVNPITASEFLTMGKGILTNTQALATAYLTSSIAKLNGETNWPDLQLLLGAISVPADNGSQLFEHAFNYQDGLLSRYMSSAEGKDSFLIAVILTRPKTRGHILLKSNNTFDYPLIDPMYYSDPNEIKIMVVGHGLPIANLGIKETLRLVENTTAFGEIGAKLITNVFPGCEVPVYRSDEYWECLARFTSSTLYHPVGTCSMGKSDSNQSVVDSKLKVIGINRLRVVDASVMPFLPGTNTHAASIMIGQMGSELILNSI